jgi:hypothetical protein
MVVHLIKMSPQYNIGMGIFFDNELAGAFNFLRFDHLPIWIGFCIVVLASILAPTHEKARACPEAGACPFDS